MPLRLMREIVAGTANRALDRCGSLGTRGWKCLAEGNVGTVDPEHLEGVLELYSSTFDRLNPQQLIRSSRLFSHIFYIVKEDSAVIGFCSCYVRPALSNAGIVLKATIHSIGVDPSHRRKGVAGRMLQRCTAEMALNGIVSIGL